MLRKSGNEGQKKNQKITNVKRNGTMTNVRNLEIKLDLYVR